MNWPESLPTAAWIALHAGAILAACLTRFSLGGRTDFALQVLTIAGFLSVAAVACLSAAQGGDQLRLWVLSGTTLGAMVVASVVERGTAVRDPLLMQFAEERAPLLAPGAGK